MSTVATPSAPVYVQQSFLWDEVDATPHGGKNFLLASSGTTSNGAISTLEAPISTKKTTPRNRQSRPPMTVPTVHTTTSARRGRCEHVGGILASVLEKYGIGLDQLIAEIDGLQ